MNTIVTAQFARQYTRDKIDEELVDIFKEITKQAKLGNIYLELIDRELNTKEIRRLRELGYEIVNNGKDVFTPKLFIYWQL